ncbi:unnamed protein product [Didymodactylos carnosus]|uniref:Fizzy-related protein homolog n=1 Tax=Didymodactylos carnosus TaxID=1234261 RepID=A0A814ZLV0_9BILA|nr:unnamed protein product [Didymodactylos carnosus]CAF1245368.1 unnamed protein product [Didymodactylos carnosus]CAF3499148.1 unnamed protein product [Didymodactylos carnosus]CAF4011131.1 unnamed protein product [Didymodactylos carnosus]
MEPDFERRLFMSMSGQSSLNSSPFSSPISTPVKHSDRFIPLRCLSQPNAYYIDQDSSTRNSALMDKKQANTRDATSASTSMGSSDRTKDILTYQALLQNEMFGTRIDTIYDEQQMGASGSNSIGGAAGNNQQQAGDTNAGSNAQSQTAQTPLPTTVNNQTTGSTPGGQSSPFLTPCSTSLPLSFRLNYTNTNPNILRSRDPNTIFKYSLKRNLDDLHYSPYTLSPLSPSSIKLLRSPRKQLRKIPKTPFKVLDAPELQDDFYLNLVDWSSTNILAVGLNASVYLWNANTSNVTRLCDLQSESDTVTSVAWSDRGQFVAVGTHKGIVQIWDAQSHRKTISFPRHTARVGALAWNDMCIYSGSRDRFIIQNDTRSNKQERKLAGHRQEVCGLKWSPDRQLLASGGNDNRLLVWNQSCSTPIQTYTDHTAAVKAIAWSPHQQGLLASGGGTADRYIRFWNTLTAQNLQCIDTGSQVCNLAWSKHSNELVSTHGYSQNQIIVWKYPTMVQLARLTGHTFRVLYLAVSPDGESIVTGAGDETLRFWNVFTKCRANKESNSVLNLFNKIR